MAQEDIEALEKKILEIAINIGAIKRSIELDELYKRCISQLSYSKEEINLAIKNLYKNKILVEGFRLTKTTLLDNKKRKQIYDYIKRNPGVHIRRIRKIFGLGAYMAFRHLKYLEIFGFIRSKKYLNKKVYFLEGTDVTEDEKIIILKNDRTKIIFDQIKFAKKVRLSELEDFLNLSHGQIQPHIKKLLDYNLINSLIENNIVFYSAKVSDSIENLTVKF